MSFLRKEGRVWTTDKDGLIPDLLAAAIERQDLSRWAEERAAAEA